MRILHQYWRRLLLMGCMSLGALLPLPALALPSVSQIYLRPHCEKTNQDECQGFLVKDPQTLVTSILKVGEKLDLDVVLKNEGNAGIERMRVWISYDPAILEGELLEISSKFPVPSPDENSFDPNEGYVKMQATTLGTKASGNVIPLARITFRTKAIPQNYATVLGFHDVKADTSGHTFVSITKEGTSENLLAPQQGSLLVPLQGGDAAASSGSSVSSTASSDNSVSTDSSSSIIANTSSSSNTRTSFILLQPQNLRVTTEGGTVYLAWDPLLSSELSGYNMYYGTVSGEYLQRRSISRNETTLALRGLPIDVTYYFAVRAVNASNEESAFSQEVAVKVGNPATSTAPLRGGQGPGGKNPVSGGNGLPGATGLPSMIVLLLALSAAIGTLFAVRQRLH